MLGMIYAASPEGVIGRDGAIPWRYPGDWRRFKRVTLGATVIMGRATFESIGKALPGRRNVVVTSRPLDAAGVERAGTLAEAVALARSNDGRDTWFIGGARVYREAMAYADRIDVTYVPDHVSTEGAVFAPRIDETVFEAGPLVPHEDEPALTRRIYERKASP
jgi:dihydrofolate reductase